MHLPCDQVSWFFFFPLLPKKCLIASYLCSGPLIAPHPLTAHSSGFHFASESQWSRSSSPRTKVNGEFPLGLSTSCSATALATRFEQFFTFWAISASCQFWEIGAVFARARGSVSYEKRNSKNIFLNCVGVVYQWQKFTLFKTESKIGWKNIYIMVITNLSARTSFCMAALRTWHLCLLT